MPTQPSAFHWIISILGFILNILAGINLYFINSFGKALDKLEKRFTGNIENLKIDIDKIKTERRDMWLKKEVECGEEKARVAALTERVNHVKPE